MTAELVIPGKTADLVKRVSMEFVAQSQKEFCQYFVSHKCMLPTVISKQSACHHDQSRVII